MSETAIERHGGLQPTIFVRGPHRRSAPRPTLRPVTTSQLTELNNPSLALELGTSHHSEDDVANEARTLRIAASHALRALNEWYTAS